jgi:hypothetical protein
VCHGCGTFHIKRAVFISSSLSIGMPREADGRMWCIPAYGCPECMKEPATADRSSKIARAFDHGMSPEARVKMEREWPEVKARLEAEQR